MTKGRAAETRKMELIGREGELRKIRACIRAGRNVLLEGPVGVGKTHLALAVTGELGRPVFRVDGDGRYTEQKLSGWFDPPLAIQKGFNADSFVAGPLVEAMRAGGVLFINEMNRLPEGVQNVLLPAIDERLLAVPRLGEIRAAEGFLVVATQNPKEFVATSHLSEAILDRFEWVPVHYQSEDEERRIVRGRTDPKAPPALPRAAVSLVRATRSSPRIKRGASVRAALSVTDLAWALMQDGTALEEAFHQAVLLALPTRIEMESTAEVAGGERELERLLQEMAREALAAVQGEGGGEVKKKT
jgi:MoxR-like ATPase